MLSALRKQDFVFQCLRKRNFSSYIHHLDPEPLRALTVGKLLEIASEKFGDRPALISRHQNRSLTFLQVLEQSDILAAGFKGLGLKKGDRIGIWAPNITQWYLTKMAAARLGLILVGLNPAYQASEIEYCINKVKLSAIVCDDKFKSQDYYEILRKIAPELQESEPGGLKSARVPSLKSVIVAGEGEKKGAFTFDEILNAGRNDKNGVEEIRKFQNDISPDDPCNIQFTSGTTGKPKAALTSHFNQVNNGYFIGKRNELDKKHQKICLQVPFFHAFGTTISIMPGLNHGSTLVLPDAGYNPNKSLDALKEEKCTIIHGTPTMYVDLVHAQEERREDISAEIAVSGGALCSPHLFKQMLSILKVKKVKSVYGLTETTAVVFQSQITEDEELATTTVGQVGEHIEAKVIDKNGTTVPFGTPGELCVRSYSNMLGYWDDEAKTKEMIGPDRWLKTGDQFVLHENGYGKVVGRLKECIIRGGENIYPKDVEEFLNTHPEILETQVIGLPHERLGEEICACVRLKPGATINLEEIQKFCKGQMAHFKIPSQLQIVSEFPKTASGKIQKFKLLELYKNK